MPVPFQQGAQSSDDRPVAQLLELVRQDQCRDNKLVVGRPAQRAIALLGAVVSPSKCFSLRSRANFATVFVVIKSRRNAANVYANARKGTQGHSSSPRIRTDKKRFMLVLLPFAPNGQSDLNKVNMAWAAPGSPGECSAARTIRGMKLMKRGLSSGESVVSQKSRMTEHTWSYLKSSRYGPCGVLCASMYNCTKDQKPDAFNANFSRRSKCHGPGRP